MNEECVIAVYADIQRARDAVHVLERGGVDLPQIAVVTNELANKAEMVADLNLGDDSLRDAVVGGGVGGVVGILAGTAVNLAVGPFSGGLLGVVVGAFIGSLGGWGNHKESVNYYETLLAHGKILLIVHGNPLELIEADRMLQETGQEEIHFNATTSSESPEVNPNEHL